MDRGVLLAKRDRLLGETLLLLATTLPIAGLIVVKTGDARVV